MRRGRFTRASNVLYKLSHHARVIRRRLSDVFAKPFFPKPHREARHAPACAEGALPAQATFSCNLTAKSRAIARRLEKALLHSLYPKPHRVARHAPACAGCGRIAKRETFRFGGGLPSFLLRFAYRILIGNVRKRRAAALFRCGRLYGLDFHIKVACCVVVP